MSAQKGQIPIDEKLFTWPSDEPRLIASKCKSCGFCLFPRIPSCYNPNCENKEVEDVLLSRRGKLRSYTVHEYAPPPPFCPPEPFVPFGIGLVSFPEGVDILGQITGCDPHKDLKIGMEVETVIEKLYDDAEGHEVVGWKFRPVK